MKRIYLIVILLLPALVFVSCTGNSGYSSYEYASDSEETEEVEDDVPKEAEKRPAIFYQRMLEVFCQRYYDDCFKGRSYHSNSIIVDGVDVVQGNWEDGNIVSWNMMVKGRHSFEGIVKNHNDSPFTAFVDELGDNSFKITFCIKRYDIFGDQMDEEETATRTMSYSE